MTTEEQHVSLEEKEEGELSEEDEDDDACTREVQPKHIPACLDNCLYQNVPEYLSYTPGKTISTAGSHELEHKKQLESCISCSKRGDREQFGHSDENTVGGNFSVNRKYRNSRGRSRSVSPQPSHHTISRQRNYHSVSPQTSNYTISRQRNYHSVSPQSSHHAISQQRNHHSVSPELSHHTISRQGNHRSVSPKPIHHTISRQGNYHIVSLQSSHNTISRQRNHCSVSPEPSHHTICRQRNHRSVSPEPSHHTISRQGNHRSVSPEPSHHTISRQVNHRSVSPEPSHHTISRQLLPYCQASKSQQVIPPPHLNQKSSEEEASPTPRQLQKDGIPDEVKSQKALLQLRCQRIKEQLKKLGVEVEKDGVIKSDTATGINLPQHIAGMPDLSHSDKGFDETAAASVTTASKETSILTENDCNEQKLRLFALSTIKRRQNLRSETNSSTSDQSTAMGGPQQKMHYDEAAYMPGHSTVTSTVRPLHQKASGLLPQYQNFSGHKSTATGSTPSRSVFERLGDITGRSDSFTTMSSSGFQQTMGLNSLPSDIDKQLHQIRHEEDSKRSTFSVVPGEKLRPPSEKAGTVRLREKCFSRDAMVGKRFVFEEPNMSHSRNRFSPLTIQVLPDSEPSHSMQYSGYGTKEAPACTSYTTTMYQQDQASPTPPLVRNPLPGFSGYKENCGRDTGPFLKSHREWIPRSLTVDDREDSGTRPVFGNKPMSADYKLEKRSSMRERSKGHSLKYSNQRTDFSDKDFSHEAIIHRRRRSQSPQRQHNTKSPPYPPHTWRERGWADSRVSRAYARNRRASKRHRSPTASPSSLSRPALRENYHGSPWIHTLQTRRHSNQIADFSDKDFSHENIIHRRRRSQSPQRQHNTKSPHASWLRDGCSREPSPYLPSSFSLYPQQQSPRWSPDVPGSYQSRSSHSPSPATPPPSSPPYPPHTWRERGWADSRVSRAYARNRRASKRHISPTASPSSLSRPASRENYHGSPTHTSQTRRHSNQIADFSDKDFSHKDIIHRRRRSQSPQRQHNTKSPHASWLRDGCSREPSPYLPSFSLYPQQQSPRWSPDVPGSYQSRSSHSPSPATPPPSSPTHPSYLWRERDRADNHVSRTDARNRRASKRHRSPTASPPSFHSSHSWPASRENYHRSPIHTSWKRRRDYRGPSKNCYQIPNHQQGRSDHFQLHTSIDDLNDDDALSFYNPEFPPYKYTGCATPPAYIPTSIRSKASYRILKKC